MYCFPKRFLAFPLILWGTCCSAGEPQRPVPIDEGKRDSNDAFVIRYTFLAGSAKTVPCLSMHDIQKAVGHKIDKDQTAVDISTEIPANAGTTIEIGYPEGHSLAELARCL